jgi:glucosamine-6-phosphate deaminase
MKLFKIISCNEILNASDISFSQINKYSFSPVERAFLEKSKRQPIYKNERIPSIIADNPYELGKLAALRFLEWIIENPKGVIALPTGKTPEYFIKWLEFYKKNWNTPAVEKELIAYNIKQDRFPETRDLKFVQLDEYFPISTKQENSYYSYVNKYYLSILDIPPENRLMIDCTKIEGLPSIAELQKLFPKGRLIDFSLINRKAENEQEEAQKKALAAVDKFCKNYEQKIKEWGGIGFFIGGIGPDGHVAFNIKGSSFESETRLIQLNYPSAASASGDLSGMSGARNKPAITIGLNTITANPDATILIMAAGETKATQVANANKEPQSTNNPASVLHNHKGARFYLTNGAAAKLEDRKLEDIKNSLNDLPFSTKEDVIIELALKLKKELSELTPEDFTKTEKAKLIFPVIENNLAFEIEKIKKDIINKIERGTSLPQNKNILHTSPHHDDIILSYHSAMRSFIKKNLNYFTYFTSGYTAVSNQLLIDLCQKATPEFIRANKCYIFHNEDEQILQFYKKAFEAKDAKELERLELVLFLQAVVKVFNLKDESQLIKWVPDFTKEYLEKRYDGQKDSHDVQILKGMLRESESNRKWTIMGIPRNQITHLRTGFYNGDYFTPQPTKEKDAMPTLDLINKVKPNIITVAYDPEGSGPDTHFKALQTLAQAIKMNEKENQPEFIYGYRNIWFKFNPSEADIFIPSTKKNFSELEKIFLNCFTSQKNAEFPSPDYDGPFSDMAIAIQKKQLKDLKVLLGCHWFKQHSNPSIRNAEGFCFIKAMKPAEFLKNVADLEKRVVKE